MSSWREIFGEPNDHVCPYLALGYHKVHRESGIIFTERWTENVHSPEDGYVCKACENRRIPDNLIKDLCFDTENAKDVYESCEEFKKTRRPFAT